MAWDYAELSKAAKAAGGPEKLVDLIEQSGKDIGRAEGQASMTPWLGAAAVGGSLITLIVIRIRNYFKEKRATSEAAVEQAKAELIQGIRDYDATHPEESEDNTSEKGEGEDG